MRIKNQISKASSQSIFSILLLLFIFIVLDVILVAGNSSHNFSFLHFIAFIFPFILLVLLGFEIKKHNTDDIITRNTESFIKYADFLNDCIVINYLNSNNKQQYYYSNIYKLELVIQTALAYGQHGTYSTIQGVEINITPAENGKTLTIYHAPVDLNKLYKIIYYSRNIKNFSYSFTGNGIQTKEKLEKIIEDYINNSYKKTLTTSLYSTVNPFVIALISIILLGGWIIFILSLFK